MLIYLVTPFCGQKIELEEISNLSKVLTAQWRLNGDLKAGVKQPVLSLFTQPHILKVLRKETDLFD